jgi:D-threo-aldose 1-dehydrogenase
MDPFKRVTIGKTNVKVTQLGFGGVPLGELWDLMDESHADATIQAAISAGINYYDTAPWYGLGKSEHRLGRVLGDQPRESFVLTTKVGRVLRRPSDVNAGPPYREIWRGALPFDLTFDYTRGGVLRSYEDSLQRLSLNRINALLIHDLDLMYHNTEEGIKQRFDELESGGGFAALEELKANGEIGAIGAGINHLGMIPQFLQRFDMDFFLVAMPYTLLDQHVLNVEFPLCVEREVAIVIGSVFASGILATDVVSNAANYNYAPAEAAIVEKAKRIQATCGRHGVPLGAAALQFPLAHQAVVSVIPGMGSSEIVTTNVEWMRQEIPEQMWCDLKDEGLLRGDAPTP